MNTGIYLTGGGGVSRIVARTALETKNRTNQESGLKEILNLGQVDEMASYTISELVPVLFSIETSFNILELCKIVTLLDFSRW